MSNWIFGLPVFSGIMTFFLLRWMLAGRNAQWVLDHPNHRSLHSAPVPRTGGIVIIVAVIAAWSFLSIFWLLGSVAFLAVLSLVDDVRGLSVRWRFLGHSIAAAGLVWWIPLHLPVLVMIGLIIGLVWMTNLYNFMDGSDGLAGGMALFGFGSYAMTALVAGDTSIALASASLAAAALAFLAYNFYPARIFLGDAGSIPLGFLAGAIGLVGWQRSLWPLWFPVLVFSPFVVDATVTLLKRLLRGEKVWQAHREHYYQRLVQMGWGHKKTALWEYALMASTGFSALWMKDQTWSVQAAGLLLWALLYCFLALLVERRCRQEC